LSINTDRKYNLRVASFLSLGAIVCLLLGGVFSMATCQMGVLAAPDFHLKTFDGKEVVLSELKGKVIVINFWATWCPPCRMEIPHLKAVFEEHRSDGLELIGISVDRGGEDVVKPFVEKNGLEYTIVMADNEVLKKYGPIDSIPVTVIVDRQGNIRHRWIGYRSEKDFVQALKPLLEQKKTE